MTDSRRRDFFDDSYVARGVALSYPDGERLPEHDHPWAQLVYAASGVMQVQTHAASWLVPTTRAIWIPPDVPHWIRMRGDVAMRTLYVTLQDDAWPARCQALEVTPLLRELILYLVAERWFYPEQARHVRLLTLLAELIRESVDVPLVLPMPTDPRARTLAERILASPGESEPLHALAGDTGASLRTLQRRFREETGLPPEVWRLRARMQQSVVMLSGGASITETALACGYSTPGAFTTAFKRLFGVTPSRYRPSLVRRS